MAEPSFPPEYHQSQYDLTVRLFDGGNFHDCIEEAVRNIEDPTMPLYYIIKNCIIIASAMTDWNDADIWVKRAEYVYRTCLQDAQQIGDTDALEALVKVRKELDELHRFRSEDVADETSDETSEEDMYFEVDGRGPSRESIVVTVVEVELSDDDEAVDGCNEDSGIGLELEDKTACIVTGHKDEAAATISQPICPVDKES